MCHLCGCIFFNWLLTCNFVGCYQGDEVRGRNEPCLLMSSVKLSQRNFRHSSTISKDIRWYSKFFKMSLDLREGRSENRGMVFVENGVSREKY